MKYLLLILSSIVCSCLCNAQKTENTLLFFFDPNECQSCINEDLNLSLRYYNMFPDQVEFITDNEEGSAKLRYFFGKLDKTIDAKSVIVNSELHRRFKKDVLVLKKDDKYVPVSNGVDLKHAFRMNATVDSIVRVDQIPDKIPGFRYNLIEHDHKLAIIYPELGEIHTTKTKIELTSRIDTAEILQALHLNDIDMNLTLSDLKKKSAVQEPFIQLLDVVFADDTTAYYFSFAATYTHRVLREEIDLVRQNQKEFRKTLSDMEMEGIIASNKRFFIAKFDKQLNYISSTFIDEMKGDYLPEYISQMFLHDHHLITNLALYRTDSTQKTPFPTYGHFELIDGSYKFIQPDDFLRPDFYDKQHFDNNCSNTSNKKISDRTYYQYVVYPYCVDLTSHILYEVPYKDILEVCKLEHKKFNSKQWVNYYNLGIVEIDKDRRLLLFRAYTSEQIYYGIFNNEGEYFGYGKLEQHIPMKATMTINGNLINISGNEIQYMKIELK